MDIRVIKDTVRAENVQKIPPHLMVSLIYGDHYPSWEHGISLTTPDNPVKYLMMIDDGLGQRYFSWDTFTTINYGLTLRTRLKIIKDQLLFTYDLDDKECFCERSIHPQEQPQCCKKWEGREIQITWIPKDFVEQNEKIKKRLEVLEELVDRPDGAGCKFSYQEICKVLK